MINQQHSPQFKKRFATQPSPCTLPPSHPSVSKINKPYSKFNRKQEARLLQRKKEDPLKQSQHRICFISPEKSFLHSQGDGCFSTGIFPTSSMMTCNISCQREESFCIGQDMDQTQTLRLNNSVLSLFEGLTSDNQRQTQAQLMQTRLQINKLTKIIEELSYQNYELRQKTQQLGLIQQFLMQRENYICELTSKNRQLNQQLNNKQHQNKQLFNKLKQTIDLFQKKTQEYENSLAEFRQKQIRHKQQLEWTSKINLELNEHINQLKHNSTHSIPTENNQNRDKSAFCKHNKTKNTSNHSHTPLDHPNRINIKHQKSAKQLTTPYLLQSSVSKSFSPCKLQICQCQHTLKQLQQQNKYNEITIDILKRSKIDYDKIKDENQKLKQKNKKLQNAVRLLTNIKQKSNSPNSSLELSLSPKKQ